MNCKSVKLILMSAVISCLTTLAVTGNVYETKIKKIKEENIANKQLIQAQLSAAEMNKDVYKTLYESQENDIKEYRVKAAQAEEELNNLKNQIYISKQKEQAISRGDYKYKDLSKYEIMTVDEMNDWIAKRAPEDSPFIGKGETFLQAAQAQNLDPKFLVAVSALESSWGRSEISQAKNNYFGIEAYNASPMESAKTFGTGLSAGINQGSAWIKSMYYNEGQTTLDSMINGKKAYCQLDDGTPSQAWLDKITAIIYDPKREDEE